MDQKKTPRTRVPNFTPDEKSLLAQLIKKKPIVESKHIDGQAIIKKQAAWKQITQEFNSKVNVHKRETITLKRAWDNMKAVKRKGRTLERENSLKTGGRPYTPSPPPEHETVTYLIENAAPVMICDLKNPHHSDGEVSDKNDKSEELLDFEIENNNEEMIVPPISVDTIDIVKTEKTKSNPNRPQLESKDKQCSSVLKNKKQVRRPIEYIRQEAVMRIKYLENKNNLETQILKTQMEVEEIKKRTALLDEKRSKILLEQARLELETKKFILD